MASNITENISKLAGLTDRQGRMESLETILFVPLVIGYPAYYLTRNDEGRQTLEDEFDVSPLSLLPGFDSPNSIGVPVAYGVAFLGICLGFCYLSPLDVTGAVLTFAGLYLGSGLAIYLATRRGMERELARRFGFVVLAGIALGVLLVLIWIVVSPLPPSAYLADPMVLLDGISFPLVTTLLGGVSGNSYVVKRNELRQLRKQREEVDSDDQESHVVTNPRRGESISDRTGRKIIEKFSESRWTAPDDLAAESSIDDTRKIEPLRDIVRKLRVEETRYENSVAKSKFAEKRRQYRTDPENRRNVAPSGFTKKTYEYIFEDTIAETRCGECNGRGALTCGNCSGAGKTPCGRCGGDGRQRCPECKGEMTVVKRDRCGVCGGEGVNQRGYTCRSCGGDGGTETRVRCPQCRGQGQVDCDSCHGSGRQRCRNCDGSGEVGCGNCGTTGIIVTYDSLTRTYKPEKNVSYRSKSVPTKLLTGADGTRTKRDRDENPRGRRVYRREEETRKIPVTVVRYEYLGDKWELFKVEGSVEALDFPRDYRKQLRIVQALAAVLVPAYLYLVFVGF